MIIKQADDKSADILALEALLGRARGPVKQQILDQLRKLRAGIKGEQEAAYELQLRFGKSKNVMVVHDLRVEHEGDVAQIDHLVLNRLMQVHVCESKHFSEGVAVNEHGEFTGFFQGKSFGLPSPIEQNERHILVLQRIFSAGCVTLPTRMGMRLKPTLRNWVLVSNNARIKRPSRAISGIEQVIKTEQFAKRLVEDDEKENPLSAIASLSKVVSSSTLEEMARSIASLHKPIRFNWAAKFGMQETGVDEAIAAVAPTGAAAPEAASATGPNSRQKLVCVNCSAAIPYNVARFCWFNKPRFGGNIYCIECQKAH